MADNDAVIQEAQREIWGVDGQIKDLNEAEATAARHLAKSIKWLDGQPRRAAEVAAAQAAEHNLRELAMMAGHLEEAYVGNATSLYREAEQSADLLKTNAWLSWCYFMNAPVPRFIATQGRLGPRISPL